MSTIPNDFKWYPASHWFWPHGDDKLKLVNDWVSDLNQVLPLIETKGVGSLCVQAGSACGVWPIFLSRFFSTVHAFEANYENYICSLMNLNVWQQCTAGMGAVSLMHAALHRAECWDCVIDHNPHQPRNAGTHYVVDAGEGCVYFDEAGRPNSERVKGLTIDAMEYLRCDFICLDVEGFEYNALRGADNTLARCNPVVMIEESQMAHQADGEHLKAREYLEQLGYKAVLKVHNDVVFKRC